MLLHVTFRLLVQSHFMATSTRPYVFLLEWNSGYIASAGAYQTSYQTVCSFSGKAPIHLNWTAVPLVHWMGSECCASCTSFWGLGTDSESQAHSLTLNSQFLLFLLRSFLWAGSQNQKKSISAGLAASWDTLALWGAGAALRHSVVRSSFTCSLLHSSLGHRSLNLEQVAAARSPSWLCSTPSKRILMACKMQYDMTKNIFIYFTT